MTKLKRTNAISFSWSFFISIFALTDKSKKWKLDEQVQERKKKRNINSKNQRVTSIRKKKNFFSINDERFDILRISSLSSKFDSMDNGFQTVFN